MQPTCNVGVAGHIHQGDVADHWCAPGSANVGPRRNVLKSGTRASWCCTFVARAAFGASDRPWNGALQRMQTPVLVRLKRAGAVLTSALTLHVEFSAHGGHKIGPRIAAGPVLLPSMWAILGLNQ